MSCIYESATVPMDHITSITHSGLVPNTPDKPDFGLDSLFGLMASTITAPMYLYASLKGKFAVWDEMLQSVPDETFTSSPTLDVGCGRGMVLLKMSQRKKLLGVTTVPKAYGIDIFSTADQTGNAPEATYKNALAMDVVDQTALHTASFTERFPFKDDTFSLITSNLALHNAKQPGRMDAVREIARVCAPGGQVIIVDLYGYFKQHKSVLVDELGWKDVQVTQVGWKMLFGSLPCQVLKATKPSTSPAAST